MNMRKTFGPGLSILLVLFAALAIAMLISTTAAHADALFDSSTPSGTHGAVSDVDLVKQYSPLGGRSISSILFGFATGESDPNMCMSCTFLSFFMMALSDFSYTVYQYLWTIMLGFAPTIMMIWIAYRAARLMISGGEDGKSFMYEVVARTSLFFVIWLVATGANQKEDYLWEFVGPQYLETAFTISQEIRAFAIDGTSAITGSSTQDASTKSITCEGVSPTNMPSDPKYIYIEKALQSGCFTERAHMLGIATGTALAVDSHGGASFGWYDYGAWIQWFWALAFKFFMGIFIALTYAVSAIWLTFLVLDVVSRGLVTAAFAPVLIVMALLKPTRNIFVSAITGLGGALVTAVALAMVTVLAFILVTNTVKVYEMTHAPIVNALETWKPETAPSGNDFGSDRLSQLHSFIDYVAESDVDKMHIPVNLATPWLWYMIFSGVAIFALGKKIIAMLESMIGYQGASQFADSALKAVKMGAVGAGISSGATLFAIKGSAMLGARGAMYSGGAMKGAAGGLVGTMGRGLNWAQGKVGSKNTLKATGMAAAAAAGTVKSAEE